MEKEHFKADLNIPLSADGKNALEGLQSVSFEVNLESFPRNNLAFALHYSSSILLEKKIYLIMKCICIFVLNIKKSYLYKMMSRNFIGNQSECSKEERVSQHYT